MDTPRFHRTGDHRVLACTALLVGLALVGSLALVPSASSATVTSAWQAKIGAKGANGTAKLQVLNTGTGSLTLRLVKMRPATLLPVVLHKGTCSAVGPVIARLDAIRSSSAGAANRTASLTATRVKALIAATRSGKIAIRIGSGSALRCGVFVALPVATPPTPSPSAGGTMFMGPYFTVALPGGWATAPPREGSSYGTMTFVGPGDQWLYLASWALNYTLAEALAGAIANLKAQTGADPEKIEDITMAGVAGKMLTLHATREGTRFHILEANCVGTGRGQGRVYEMIYTNPAGTEAADRAFFLGVLASFGFGPGF